LVRSTGWSMPRSGGLKQRMIDPMMK
jgi:hypothetical protein